MPDRDLYVPPNVSTEEVYRLILTLRGEMRDANTKLDNKPSMSDLENLKGSLDGKASNGDFNHLRERIVDLESWQTWAMRLGIPALLGIVFNLLDTFKGV